ncbi:EVE domain-containing protein [Candidatus Thiodictyon syntrophicum]|jgi:predicted RNA-binding protein with PUA-like domain|uniref:EVE domain-containing protein n=1 Tax=Candidatus Thiodictyon syntrophicum TaxID=1166950 RepID=A0A2K8U4P1_9GAMM|nr:EVE domain-containing protein [Candidatus Thiodictyon syntrophicum]AUB80369.1 EVE domain-containing protein [Candidatus Thiodictyon syntrophicum]
MAYWLFKSEPDAFSIEDLKAKGAAGEPWDGVRNYQARNMIRDQMRIGDGVLFYHSNCAEPGVVGLAEVASQAYPDATAFDPQAKYCDPKSDPERPRWYLVELRYVRHLRGPIPLREIKLHADGPLADMPLVRRGNRLSVMPVTPAQWDFILGLEAAQ